MQLMELCLNLISQNHYHCDPDRYIEAVVYSPWYILQCPEISDNSPVFNYNSSYALLENEPNYFHFFPDSDTV